MDFIRIHTRKLIPPKDDLLNVIDESLPELKNGDIVIFASKVVSIYQGRCIPQSDVSKFSLISKETDYFIKRKDHSYVTVINHAFALNAGLDPYEGYYVLLPENPQQVAKQLHAYLKQRYSIDKLGVIIADSHSTPLRRGVLGYAVGYYGINPLIDPTVKGDFSTQTVNILDALTSLSVIYLGESQRPDAPRTPIVIARYVDFIEFSEDDNLTHFYVDPAEDLFEPLIKHFKKS